MLGRNKHTLFLSSILRPFGRIYCQRSGNQNFGAVLEIYLFGVESTLDLVELIPKKWLNYSFKSGFHFNLKVIPNLTSKKALPNAHKCLHFHKMYIH